VTTRSRFYALQWFFDHEARGPNAVIDRKPPTARMVRLMKKEGELTTEPVGQFKYHKWILSPAGHEKLRHKPPPRKKKDLPHADNSQRKQDGQSAP